ncbi:MAG: SDR family NAD(P)-dependent oxidoreductase [Gammaproteobacteria bacterium]
MGGLELQDKVAIVTGGADGIGAATVRALAERGCAVAIFDRDAGKGDAVAAQQIAAGRRVTNLGVDLADSASLSGAVQGVLDAHGRIDILVNCAGVTGGVSNLADTTEAIWDFVFAVNVKAPFLLIRQVAAHMIARGGGGRIVNVSSSSAYRALMSVPAYGSSKAALSQLTRCAAAELGPHDINVNTVAPGLTDTKMGSRNETFAPGVAERLIREGPISNLLARISTPEDVAAVIVFLCLPASRQITAQTIHTSAGAIV